MIDELKLEIMKAEKDVAYWERQQLVAALSHIFPAFLAKHPEDDKDWAEDWRTIVVIILPLDNQPNVYPYKIPRIGDVTGQQLTWHIHDFDLPMFDHLQYQGKTPMTKALGVSYDDGYSWDGHTTEEKYKRLREWFKRVDHDSVQELINFQAGAKAVQDRDIR